MGTIKVAFDGKPLFEWEGTTWRCNAAIAARSFWRWANCEEGE